MDVGNLTSGSSTFSKSSLLWPILKEQKLHLVFQGWKKKALKTDVAAEDSNVHEFNQAARVYFSEFGRQTVVKGEALLVCGDD